MKLSTVVAFTAGLAIGYTLGAAADRGRYQQIKRAASDLINHPKVQETVFNLAEQTKASAQHLPHPAADVVDTAATHVQDIMTDPSHDTGSDPGDGAARSDR